MAKPQTLPFEEGTAGAPPPASTTWTLESSTIPIASRPADSPETALPFSADRDAPAPSVSGIAEQVPESAGSTIAINGALDRTSLPFARPAHASSGVVTLTLQQFAQLRSSCEAEPERTAELYAALGATDATARAALDAHWSAHFALNATEAQLFELMKQRISSS